MDHSHPKFKMLEAVNGSRNTAVKLAADGDGEIPVTVDKLPVPAEVGAAAVDDDDVGVCCCRSINRKSISSSSIID